MRRYPRSWGADRMQNDVKAVLEGESLPKQVRTFSSLYLSAPVQANATARERERESE
jgi:hypothetical protein